jgi:hypothetical protein
VRSIAIDYNTYQSPLARRNDLHRFQLEAKLGKDRGQHTSNLALFHRAVLRSD